MVRETTVLITGISGFLGAHLSQVLRDAWPEARLVGASRSPSREGAEWIRIDLLDASAVRHMVNSVRPDYVFHLAGRVNASDWTDLYRGNVETTLNLLESLVVTANPPRVVVVGSAAEYGCIAEDQLPINESAIPNPISPYGVAKTWQTVCARSFAFRGVPIVVGRVFNVIGAGLPETSAFGTFSAQLKRMISHGTERRLHVGNLSSLRDCLDVRDVCHALIALARSGRAGEIYNVCSGESVCMRDALGTLIALSGLSVEILVDEAKYRPDDVPVSYGSREKIGIATGWIPRVPLRESLRAMLD